jgi:hypothetical protein
LININRRVRRLKSKPWRATRWGQTADKKISSAAPARSYDPTLNKGIGLAEVFLLTHPEWLSGPDKSRQGTCLDAAL